jgi:hypothetical protein
MDEFKLDPEDKNIRLAVIQKYQKKNIDISKNLRDDYSSNKI